MLTALKINVQIVYYVVEFAFFAVGHTHMYVCWYVRVCVCVSFDDSQLRNHWKSCRIIICSFLLFSSFDFYFAFDFTGRFQLVD